MKCFTILFALFYLLTFKSYATDKEDIIKLTIAKTREEVIITHLKAQAELKLSFEDIQELKAAGVGEKVINFITEHKGDMTTLYNPPYLPRYYDGWKYGQYDYFYYMFFYGWMFPCHSHHRNCHHDNREK